MPHIFQYLEIIAHTHFAYFINADYFNQEIIFTFQIILPSPENQKRKTLV